jgi:beta-lactamase class A
VPTLSLRPHAKKLGALALTASVVLTGAACSADPAAPNKEAAGKGAASTPDTKPAAATRPAATLRPFTGTPAPRQAEVRRALKQLERSYHGRIGAYAIDTGTGRTVGHRAGERFPSNSSVKAPLCGAVLHQARTKDPGLMGRTLRWRERDVERNSPVTDKPEPFAKGMTTAELCRATITTSDNTAANVLLKQIGGAAGMTRFYRYLGDPIGRTDRLELELNNWQPGEKRDTITPAGMARDLHQLTFGKGLSTPDRKQMITWLKDNLTGDNRIRAGLPKDWTIGDKTGTGFSRRGEYAAASDIGVAWPTSGSGAASGGKPIVLAVYIYRSKPGGSTDEQVIARTATLLAAGLGKLPFPKGA